MPTLTMEQIAGQIQQSSNSGASVSFANGMPDMDTNGPIAIAVAMAESGGETDVKGGPNSNGSFDYGLWQINGSAHADKFDPSSNTWMDPRVNWTLAVAVWNGQGWRAWSAYKNGSYRTFLLRAQQAWRNPDYSLVEQSAVSGAIGGAVDGAVDTAQFLTSLSNPETWMRVGLVVGGAIAVMVALWTLVDK